MKRKIEQWRNMIPEAVEVGSRAMIHYCIEDARSDILELSAERDRLRAENAELLAALQKITRTSCGIEEGNKGPIRAWGECCAIARAALAKAKGETP